MSAADQQHTPEKGLPRSHGKCWTGAEYRHVCQQPSGRACIDCGAPAGTNWGPLWCPDCDVIRLDRVGAQLTAIRASMTPLPPASDGGVS